MGRRWVIAQSCALCGRCLFRLPEVFSWSALHGDAGLVRLLVLSHRLPCDTPGRKSRKSFSHSEMDCDTWKQRTLAATGVYLQCTCLQRCCEHDASRSSSPCPREEVFFPVLPLADVEHFLSSSGSLKLKAEVLFHFMTSKVPRLTPFLQPASVRSGLWRRLAGSRFRIYGREGWSRGRAAVLDTDPPLEACHLPINARALGAVTAVVDILALP